LPTAVDQYRPNVDEKIALLKIQQGKPVVEINRTLYPLPDQPISRWWLQAYFDRIIAEGEAAEQWFQAYHPLQLNPPNIPFLRNNFRGEYQRLAVKRMEFGSVCLWFDMGLGKTFVTIARCMQLYGAGLANTFLIICPTSVFITWNQQLIEHIDRTANIKIIMAHGTKRERNIIDLKTNYIDRPTFIITSYETNAVCWKALAEIRIDVIIFDEVSKIKNMPRARTKAAHALARAQRNAFIYELSGTPSSKNINGFYSLYELLFPSATGFSSFKAFEDYFNIKTEFLKLKMPPEYSPTKEAKTISIPTSKVNTLKPFGSDKTFMELGFKLVRHRIVEGEKNILVVGKFYKLKPNLSRLSKLSQLTRNLAYSLKKEQVAKDLPPKTFIPRYVQMTDEQKKLYKQIVHEHAAEFKTVKFNFSDAFSPHIKLHQIANGYIKIRETVHVLSKQPKLDELDLILDEIPDEKIIIWSPFRPQINMVIQHLNKLKLPAWEIHGGIPIAARGGILQEFRATKPPCFLVANPEVAGMGLNLEFSNYQIFMTNWFKPDTRQQAIDRQHRITQVKNVIVIDLIATGSLEPRILNALNQEIQIENKILMP
jgi:SNF2 family DNA or RNA helicase